jgi:major type 1 subunit fimbrin (pilin)
MNKRILALAIAASLLPLVATASDGTLTFGGELKAATCNITGSKDFTVTLPTVSASSFATTTDKVGDTLFSIAVSGCTALLTGANVYFEHGPNVVSATGNLKNTASSGAATNVELSLFTTSGQPIDLAPPTGLGQYQPFANNLAANAGRLDFIVAYFSNGVVTPGTVQSSVTYSMVYN